MVLKDMDSEAGQHQESMVVSLGPSRDAERFSFSKVPKGVSSLVPVIGMLMDKVAQRVTLFASATTHSILPGLLRLNGFQRPE